LVELLDLYSTIHFPVQPAIKGAFGIQKSKMKISMKEVTQSTHFQHQFTRS